jgi:hypothetical protein
MQTRSLTLTFKRLYRYQWLTFNLISRERTSWKRLRGKDVLSPEEFQRLAEQLSVRDRAMAMLAGSTGLRRSEIIALTWSDLDVRTNGSECLELLCARPIREHETESSGRLSLLIQSSLRPSWIGGQSRFTLRKRIFFSLDSAHGSRTQSGQSVEEECSACSYRQALRASKSDGTASVISLATNLRALDVDIKAAQELLQQASNERRSTSALELYPDRSGMRTRKSWR